MLLLVVALSLQLLLLLRRLTLMLCLPLVARAFTWYTVSDCVMQEAFDAQSFVSRLLGFGDMKGLVQQIQENQEGSGDPKEMMCVYTPPR